MESPPEGPKGRPEENRPCGLGLYWDYMGMVDKKMEATILGYIGLG